jgi:hypothetical protein
VPQYSPTFQYLYLMKVCSTHIEIFDISYDVPKLQLEEGSVMDLNILAMYLEYIHNILYLPLS